MSHSSRLLSAGSSPASTRSSASSAAAAWGRSGRGATRPRHASVAIKFIDPEYADSKEAAARFVTEARAAATLHSKHAIQIFDHGLTDDGRPYMVMELLTGEPLDKRIDRLGCIGCR